MRTIKIYFTLLLAVLLGGCGGGGGNNACVTSLAASLGGCGNNNDKAPSPPTAEGFWSGTTGSGLYVDLAILENGSTWGVYQTSKGIVGALVGTTITNGSTLAATGLDFNISSRTIEQGAVSGTFISKSRIQLNFGGDIFNGSYNAEYERPASLKDIFGVFSGQGVSGNSFVQEASVSINSLGEVSSFSPDCSISGSVAPRASRKNVFDVRVTFRGPSCALGNGTVTTGIAYYDVITKKLLVLATNSAVNDGFIFAGTKL